MNYHYLHGDGTGPLTGALIFGFLTIVIFFCGLMLVAVNNGRPRIWGFWMIVAAVLMSIVGLLIYSSTRTDLW